MDTHSGTAHDHAGPPEGQHHSHEREFEVAVIGGSAAGLAAALQVARQRRSVVVIDDGTPRNAAAAHLHGYLGFDGQTPATLGAAGRNEVRSYGGEILAGRVTDIAGDDGQFRVVLAGGHTLVARKIVAATGLADELPAIDGIAARWGSDVIHCPFCHGFEFRDRRIVHVITHPMALHAAGLFRHLSARLTLVLHEGVDRNHSDVGRLEDSGVSVIDTKVAEVVGGSDGRVEAVMLVDGGRIDADAVVVSPRFRARIEPFASLDLATSLHLSGLGTVVDVDDIGQTSVAGVYAAGNITDPSLQLLHAAAAGSRVGAMVCSALAHQDLGAAGRPSVVEASWDRRYAGDPTWSGNPNGQLVAQVTGMPPGRALDIGAGEGGDAIWLAEQGWQVTASDVSRNALNRIASLAAERNLEIRPSLADVGGLDPFETERFDLVTAHYVPVPRSPDNRAIASMIAAVAPGGTLLFVAHDPEPMRPDGTPDGHRSMFDPDAYVQVEDVAAVLDALPHWTIGICEQRTRVGNHNSPHVDDVVLRARRLH